MMGDKSKKDIFSILNNKGKKRPSTLLEKFIRDKIARYKPTERKGTPKGDPIGFSESKYKAALSMILDFYQKEIAAELGISFGVYRKWNTEEEFKSLINELCEEFVEQVHRCIEEKVEQLGNESEKKIRVETLRPLDFSIGELRDSNIYSPRLFDMISEKALSVFKNELSDTPSLDNINKALTINILYRENILGFSNEFHEIMDKHTKLLAKKTSHSIRKMLDGDPNKKQLEEISERFRIIEMYLASIF